MKWFDSKIAFLICALILTISTVFYYPKFNQTGTEATLSWDVSGYYLYLPAVFIYQDIKGLEFVPELFETYHPTPGFQQAFKYQNGNYVMKYSCGQAVMYLPFFTLGHLYAKIDARYPADGLSYPYQVAIGLGSLIFAFIGLWMLRKILLLYFAEMVVSLTLLLIVATTNYLEYAGITGAMTHNYLFTIYTFLIWTTIKFYEKPSYPKALGIGFFVGLLALTRPTEIIACLIPIFWGVGGISAFRERLGFLWSHAGMIILSGFVCGVVGMIQLLYWKYVSGDWVVYSYEDQGFSWRNPYIYDCLFSYKAGWLIYTPSAVFFLIGLVFLIRYKMELFWAVFFYAILHMYITFAWDIWWYGGALGQRSMVQSYAALSIPLAAFIHYITKNKILLLLFLAICMVFSYYNFWLVHQSHKGGLLRPEQMTGAYLWGIMGKNKVDIDKQKLLDTDEYFKGERKDVQKIHEENFDRFPQENIKINPEDSTDGWLLLNQQLQFSPGITLKRDQISEQTKWLRVSADHYTPGKEWVFWRMTQLVVRFKNQDETVKERMIRVHRILNEGSWKLIFMDVKVPKEVFTEVEVFYWNADGPKTLLVDDLVVEAFR